MSKKKARKKPVAKKGLQKKELLSKKDEMMPLLVILSLLALAFAFLALA